MKMKMKKNKKIKYLIAAALLTVVVTGTLTAYLKESDSLYNLFTIGKAKVDIDEGDFSQNKVISPGHSTEKAPKAKNTGTIDEYVFIEVTLPQREISVLNDVKQAPETTPNPKKEQSLFSTGVISSNTGVPVETVNSETVTYDDFVYNTTEVNGGKWVFVKTEYTPAVSATATTAAKDATRKFIFGYSGALAPDKETATIFDTVTLKRFIEEGVEGGTLTEINVNAICIQSNNLDGNNFIAPLDQTELEDLYTICKNKGLTK